MCIPFLQEELIYRVTHLHANQGWVDFDLGCSNILPSCSAAFAKFPPAQAESGRKWHSQNPSQPNPSSPGDRSHCIVSYSDDEPVRQGRRGSLRPARAAVDRNVLINRPREIVSSERRIRSDCDKKLMPEKVYFTTLLTIK